MRMPRWMPRPSTLPVTGGQLQQRMLQGVRALCHRSMGWICSRSHLQLSQAQEQEQGKRRHAQYASTHCPPSTAHGLVAGTVYVSVVRCGMHVHIEGNTCRVAMHCLQRSRCDSCSALSAARALAPALPASQADDQVHAANAQHAIGAPPPAEPQYVFPLCHHHVSGPPEFARLADRRMSWFPLAMHDPGSQSSGCASHARR